MDTITKEVYFDQYCKSCKNSDLEESKDPCHDCLQTPVNYNSHKPVYWKGSADDGKQSTEA